jgi:hypothetical protein
MSFRLRLIFRNNPKTRLHFLGSGSHAPLSLGRVSLRYSLPFERDHRLSPLKTKFSLCLELAKRKLGLGPRLSLPDDYLPNFRT